MGSCYLQACCLCLDGNMKRAYQIVHSAEAVNLFSCQFLSIPLIFPPAERRRQLFVCVFLPKSSPVAPHLFLLTVLFEQLQQGNVSTAFQAQALCGSVFYQAFLCIYTQTGSTQHASEAKYQHHSSS